MPTKAVQACRLMEPMDMEPMDLATPAHFTMGHRDSMMLAEDITALASQVSMDGAAPKPRCKCSHPVVLKGAAWVASTELGLHLPLGVPGLAGVKQKLE